MKFLAKFVIKGLDSGDSDGDPGGRGSRGRDREGPLGRPEGWGRGRGQASYQGSREPAGQAGRRAGRRRSYSPWWSQPCREAGTDTRDSTGRAERQTGVSAETCQPPFPPPGTSLPLVRSLSLTLCRDPSLPAASLLCPEHSAPGCSQPPSWLLTIHLLTHTRRSHQPARRPAQSLPPSPRPRIAPGLSLCLSVAAPGFSLSEPHPHPAPR